MVDDSESKVGVSRRGLVPSSVSGLGSVLVGGLVGAYVLVITAPVFSALAKADTNPQLLRLK
jgi:hypothetical protein